MSKPAHAKPFLTATWSDLVLLTYAVAPTILERRLPSGLELETRAGQAFVSLVAFNFLDARVFGVPWPGYRNFAELNLRCYVQHRGQRGVMFLREFVPKRLVSWVAKTFYNERYRTASLSSQIIENSESRRICYELQWAGRAHHIKVMGKDPPYIPEESSDEHYFKEQRWGYGITRSGRALRYEVEHPCWQVFGVQEWQVDLDWELVYGPEWRFLREAQPASVMYAQGSPVKVYPCERLPD